MPLSVSGLVGIHIFGCPLLVTINMLIQQQTVTDVYPGLQEICFRCITLKITTKVLPHHKGGIQNLDSPSTPLLGHSLLTNQEAVLPLNNQRDWTQETLMRTVGVPCVVPTIRAHACNNRCMSAANAKGNPCVWVTPFLCLVTVLFQTFKEAPP